MSKSFNQLSDQRSADKQYRVLEVEAGRFIKRTFNKDNSFSESNLSITEQEINKQFKDIPF